LLLLHLEHAFANYLYYFFLEIVFINQLAGGLADLWTQLVATNRAASYQSRVPGLTAISKGLGLVMVLIGVVFGWIELVS
jgi:hypothetical protein